MNNEPGIVVWFRQDLRTIDNPALAHAARKNIPVYPVYIWSPEDEDQWSAGGASRYWLYHSLANLKKMLKALGSDLIIRSGNSKLELIKLLDETGSSDVCWNKRYEPLIYNRDRDIEKTLSNVGVIVNSFNGSLLREPVRVTNNKSQPYLVFTAYWKKFLKLGEPNLPAPAPDSIMAPSSWPGTLNISDLELEPKIKWTRGIDHNWKIGCEYSTEILEEFLGESALSAIDKYDSGRDIPSEKGTSRMSPYLHFGEISPRQIWHAVRSRSTSLGLMHEPKDSNSYLRQLVWREFAHQLLHHFPETPDTELKEKFRGFPYIKNQKHLESWQKGMTGYPIVDAGMRELWATGWMHNRVRMIVASFLIKDLMIDWREGAKWFWDTLLDADLANNTMGWQWVSGAGADASPYYRIFNPTLQGEKFDPLGIYIRQWVPELSKLPNKVIHQPWSAGSETLEAAGIKSGVDYPDRIVDHAEAREHALNVYKEFAG
ncbi:MAG: deoxyribodipyrimidine photo-lyase [Gammaproteobacteria bacterium]